MTTKDESADESDEKSIGELPLSLDAILGILASHRRRALLEYLWDQPDHVGSVEEATRQTIVKIGKKQGTQPNHENIRVDLQHHHLPKMADAGVIEYDIRSQTIRYRENERLETAYESVRDLELD